MTNEKDRQLDLVCDGQSASEDVHLGTQSGLEAHDIDTLEAMNNVGVHDAEQNRLKEAESMYLQVLQVLSRSTNLEERPRMLKHMVTNNLSIVYAAQGRLKKSEEMYQSVLKGYIKERGSHDSFTLDVLNSLGLLYAEQGRLEKAEAMYQQALQASNTERGDTSIFRVYNNFGILCRSQGRLEEAEEMYRAALEGYEERLGGNHPSTLDVVNNLGVLFANQSKLQEDQQLLQQKLQRAEEMFQKAVDGYQRQLGWSHPSSLGAINNLARCYADLGWLDKAEEYYGWALAGFQKCSDSKYSTVLRNIHDLRGQL